MEGSKPSNENAAEISSVTRRGFCNGLLLTGAGLVAVAAGGGMAEDVVGQSRGVAYPPLRIDGAGALMPGSALFFNYPRTCDPAILARTDDGSYYAYSQKCSHLGCSVKFSRALNRLDCPCHRGSYDVKTGVVVDGPPRRALDEIILAVRGAEVWAVGRRTEIDNPVVA